VSLKTIQPLSSEDQAFLTEAIELSRPKGWRGAAGLLLMTLFALVAYSAAALVVAAILAWLAGFPIAQGAWRQNPVTWYGAIGLVVAVCLGLSLSLFRWQMRTRKGRALQRQALADDLAGNRVEVEEHAVTGVKLLQEPEHQAFIFFLRLQNGKTLVLYDHDSHAFAQDDRPSGKPTLAVRDRISLRTFPVSQRKRWSFGGETLPLPAPIELALAPENWPDDESWCRVKWENIERHFGPKASRQAADSKRS
jgi:membrane protein implicated in regulation of membrane protease activity